MAKPPRRPREIKRATEADSALVTSRPLVRRANPRQAGLFQTSFIEPCKPTLRPKAPTGARWQFEIKHDGYRAQAHVGAGRVQIFTKSGFDWASRFPTIVAALERLPVEDAVIDGEACVVGDDGVTDFFALHKAASAGSAPAAVLYAFDLLHLDGEDLRQLPLDERRLLLEDLLHRAGEPAALPFSEHVLGDGPEIARSACALGLEGIVAKVRDAPYRSGRSETWLKIKCTRTEAFEVVGFDPDGRAGVRSIDIVRRKGRKLEPAGSVGSGLTLTSSREIRAALDAGRKVIVEVEHRGATPSGGVRHGAIKRHRFS